MRRSDFFTRILLGSGILLTGQGLTSGPVSPVRKERRLCSPYVAGYWYYDGIEAEADMSVNDPLTLKRQPENPYDRYAIEVFHDGLKLGYLPRTDNRIPARLMDQGVEVKACIIKIGDEEEEYYRKVRMKVYFEELVFPSNNS